MRQGASSDTGAFLTRPAVPDVGMGALLFFASHMVIRTTYHVGMGRTEAQMSVFLLVVLGSVALAHLFWRQVLKVRLDATAYTGAPIASVLAGAGVVLSLVSMLPGAGGAYFFLGGAFVGASIGWFSTIVASSICTPSPSAHLFKVPWSLLFACLFYFLFRFASSVSASVGEGLLLALPLVTVACGPAGQPGGGDPDALTEGRRSLQVLVWVSAAFAVLGSAVIWASFGDVEPLDSSVNRWTLFEAIAAAVLLGSCCVLYRLSCQRVLPPRTPLFVCALCLVPPLLVGGATAAAFVPVSNGSLMWESSFWVLIVAVFAYDMKATPYSMDGLGLGVMFEAMCVGQMVVQLVSVGASEPWAAVLGSCLALAYLVGTVSQLLSSPTAAPTVPSAEKDSAAPPWDGTPSGPVQPAPTAYALIARRFGLTDREEHILELVGDGRSASYISDTLGISFHTARTHIRHVYEKMGVHSKQELIDMVHENTR